MVDFESNVFVATPILKHEFDYIVFEFLVSSIEIVPARLPARLLGESFFPILAEIGSFEAEHLLTQPHDCRIYLL